MPAPTDSKTAFRILTLCANNASRSRLAEAIIETRGPKRPAGVVRAVSAGIKPASTVNEYTIVTLQTHGLGPRTRETRPLESLQDEHFDLVITLCEQSAQACPRFANTKAQVHWPLEDPLVSFAAATARVNFANCFDALVTRINALLWLPLESLTPEELQAKAQEIHDGLTAPERRSSGSLRKQK